MRPHILTGLLHASGVAVYVTLIALLMRSVERWFGSKPDGIFSPIAFLLLFVISAAITSTLVLGRPILTYLDGRKRDAIALFLATIGWLIVVLVAAFIMLAVT